MTTEALGSSIARAQQDAPNFMARHGARAADGGYHVLPIIPFDKAPGRYSLDRWLPETGWSRFCERPPTENELEHWASWPGCGVGFATGKLVGIDIDLDEPNDVARVRELASKVLGVTPLVRYGRWPRAMLLFQADTPFPSVNLSAGKAVATYAQGRQFVAWGIHPITEDPYFWESETPAETALDTLPVVTHDRVKAFIAQVATILTPEQIGRLADEREPYIGRGDRLVSELAPIPTIESALASVPLGSQDPYEYWLNIGMACHAGSGGSSDGLAAWDDWSSREDRYEPGACAKKWQSFAGGAGVSVGTLFGLAFKAGWTVPEGMHLSEREARIEREIQSGAFDFTALLRQAQEAAGGAANGMTGVETPPSILATPYVWKEPETIPLRQWVYGRSLLRGHLSVLVAMGAAGKTSMLASQALALVTGRPLLGKSVWDGPKRAWLWNLEDSGEELSRLIQAAAKHHRLTPQDIGNRLFVDSGLDGATLNLTRIEQRGAVTIAVPVVEALTAELIARKIDVLIVDPFVSSHSAPENDNTAIDLVAKAWAHVAKDANCAVLLAHHTKKMAGQEASVESSRGASALTNAARSVIALNSMTIEDANYLGVHEADRFRYFRAVDGKNNRAPMTGESDWHERISVSLGNGGFEGGDSMPVIVPWTPPNAFDGVTVADLKAVQAKVADGDWRADLKANDWVGHIVSEVLGIDPGQPLNRNRIKKVLAQWITSGALRVVHERDPKTRKAFDYVRVGQLAE